MDLIEFESRHGKTLLNAAQIRFIYPLPGNPDKTMVVFTDTNQFPVNAPYNEVAGALQKLALKAI